MSKLRSIGGRLIFTAVILGGVFVFFRQGLVPRRLSPLPALSLDTPGGWGWVVDWQLAALQNEREACNRLLQPPNIEAAAISDSPLKNGCGWVNSVRLSTAGGARVPANMISCPWRRLSHCG